MTLTEVLELTGKAAAERFGTGFRAGFCPRPSGSIQSTLDDVLSTTSQVRRAQSAEEDDDRPNPLLQRVR
jgi:hypothetical protein